jgi:peptidoglycan/LPS O-acetylase OafA/YrhL
MDYLSIWPFFAGMALLLLIVATPLFAALDAPAGAERVTTLDGLRGYLALAVVFHHGAIYHGYLESGAWQLPPSHFYALAGPMGVALFFMITGYLFWGRLVSAGGMLDWRSLYIGRVFRLGPVYFLAVGIMFAVIFASTGLVLNVSVWELARQVGSWLILGVIKGPKLNGFEHTEQILAGVTWTLRYEWLFYFSLPLLAWALRKGYRHLPLAGLIVALPALVLLFIPPNRDVYATVLFGLGMLTASLQQAGLAVRLPDGLASVVVLGLLGSVLFFDTAYQTAPMLLMGAAFCLIANGCTVFGLLTLRPAYRLGAISYGIYLLQGLALAAFFRPDAMRAYGLSSPWAHWSLVAASLLLLLAGSALAHVLLERPGIAFGKVVDRRYRR